MLWYFLLIPPQIGDPTAAGNTCDDADDAIGCIFTLQLIVNDAEQAEIDEAVAGIEVDAAGNKDEADDEADDKADDKAAEDKAAGDKAQAGGKQAASQAGASQAATGTVNVQTFTGALGGPPPAVESSAGDRPFSVNGATFVNIGAAIQRSCAVQNNACSNAANSGADFEVSDCGAQEDACRAAGNAKLRRAVKVRQNTALDFGACGSPEIKFAAGLDGRKENSFAAVNNADFNHGSALNIKVIADFNCGQLESKCKADAATVAACKSGASAASSLKGQAAADAFNAAIGA